jgi:hypothetical protein
MTLDTNKDILDLSAKLEEEDTGESLDLEIEIASRSKIENYIKNIWTFILILFHVLYQYLRNFVVFLFGVMNVGVINRKDFSFCAFLDHKKYKVFMPVEQRFFEGRRVTYKTKGEIIHVLGGIEKKNITREFCLLAGPKKNFFGVPVTVDQIWNSLPMNNFGPRILLIIEISEKGKKIQHRFEGQDYIDIYEWS